MINGISDVVVAVSQGGILISNKERSTYLKPLVKDFLDRPMVEERRWGSYRVLHFETLPDGNKFLTSQFHYFQEKTSVIRRMQSAVKYGSSLRETAFSCQMGSNLIETDIARICMTCEEIEMRKN